MAELEGNRFGELWLSIGAILKLVVADEKEIYEIKQHYERQFSQVRYKLSE